MNKKLYKYCLGYDPYVGDDSIRKSVLAEFFNIADPIYSKGADIGLPEEEVNIIGKSKYVNMSIHALLLHSDVASIGLSLEEKRLLKEANIGDVDFYDTGPFKGDLFTINWDHRPFKAYKISK